MKLIFFLFPLILAHNSLAQVFNDISSLVNIPFSGIDSVRVNAGIGVIDYDNDGDDDVLLSSAETSVAFYRNDGNFQFNEITEASGLSNLLYVSAVSSADLNNDGWQDLILTTIDGHSTRIYKNNQDGTFIDISEQSGITNLKNWGTSITIGDFNNDTFLDFYIGNHGVNRRVQIVASPAAPNEFYVSQGEAFNYMEVASQMGIDGNGYSLAVKFVDFDMDNDLDLYVCNDFGSTADENKYYENTDGSLTEKGSEYGLNEIIFGMGIGYGDFDNDEDFDFYLSDIGPNEFLQNNGEVFSDITGSTFAIGDYVSWGAQFQDVTNDGLLDIVLANGPVLEDPIEQPFQFYQNIGGQFVAYQSFILDYPFFARGMAVSDFDNDGDLDVMINALTEKDTLPGTNLKVLENETDLRYKQNNYLQVDIESTSGNRDALGAIVKVKLNDGTILTRCKDVGGTFISVNTKTQHFGLGARTIDELYVIWPGTDEPEVFEAIPVNSLIYIKEGEGVTVKRSTTLSTINSGNPDLLNIFPTITTDELIIESNLHEAKFLNLNIYTLTGKEVLAEKIMNTALQEFSISLTPGLYMVRLSSKKYQKTQKIIVK